MPPLPHSPRAVARLVLLLTMSLAPAASALATLPIVPMPREVSAETGHFHLTSQLTPAIIGASSPRLEAGLRRFLHTWEARTGLAFERNADGTLAIAGPGAAATLMVDVADATVRVPTLGEDESYSLTVEPQAVTLRAPRTAGALHALSTLRQLLAGENGRWSVTAVRIQDEPRFPWRGLLLDTARHFMPVETVKRQLDGMALVKMNVLHFHLCDDQGFRVESRRFPQLHRVASDGQYYTQAEIAEILAYAADRGIRVVPEFDVPGHATALLTAYPELGAMPGPYVLEKGWGIFSPVLDPTKEEVYTFLEQLFEEMAQLFPDPYFHIGGDEVDGKHWAASERIRAFMAANHLPDHPALHAHFNQRLQTIVTRIGKKMMGWDEILHPALPQTAIVHAWQGSQRLAAATKAGHGTVLSAGYYLDLSYPAHQHYAADPLPVDLGLSDADQQRVLGGEACMWSEWITPETIDGRLWPRAAAVAERLWSPATTRDVAALYDRLAPLGRRLEDEGLRHEVNRTGLLRRYAGDRADAETVRRLSDVIDLLEPVKGYTRINFNATHTRTTPLTGLVDIARPESVTAWRFHQAIEAHLKQTRADPRKASAAELRQLLASWEQDASALLVALPTLSPRADELRPILTSLATMCTLGVRALEFHETQSVAEAYNRGEALEALAQLSEPRLAIEFAIAPGLRRLIEAAH